MRGQRSVSDFTFHMLRMSCPGISLVFWVLITLGTLCLMFPAQVAIGQQPAPSIAELENRLAQNPDDADAHYELGLADATEDQVDAALMQLETATRLAPQVLKYGNAYRMMCIKFDQVDRGIKFLENSVKEMEKAEQDYPELRLHLALAYVDKMPSSNIGIVTQARLSTKSIRQLKKVLARQPDSWPATFALGMNHLYWPRAMRHLPRSIEAFGRCLDIQDAIVKKTGEQKFYFVRGYLGLGDAYVKGKKYDKAREIWRKAKVYFPDDPRLNQRLGITDDKALGKLVGEERGLGSVVNTDLTILWSSKSVYEDVFGKGVPHFLR